MGRIADGIAMGMNRDAWEVISEMDLAMFDSLENRFSFDDPNINNAFTTM